MTTWTGNGSTYTSSGRTMYLSWQVDSSDPDYNSTSIDWRLRIWVNTSYSINDPNNSFSVSGSWYRAASSILVKYQSPSGSPPGPGYQLLFDETNTDTGLGWGSTSSRSFSSAISGLYITDTNGVAASSISTQSFSKTIPTPTAPSEPRSISSTPGNGTISVSYAAPSDTGTGGINRYEYSYNNSTWTSVGNVTSFTLTGRTNGTSYTVYVRAINAYGQASSSVSTTTTPRTVPDAPTSFTANNATFGQLSLSWAAPSSNGGAAVTGYTLIRTSPGTVTTLLTNASQTTFTDTNLLPYTDYTYTVAAVNVAGTSATASVTQKTMGGIAKVFNSISPSPSYITVLPKVYNGSTWLDAQARIYDGIGATEDAKWKHGI